MSAAEIIKLLSSERWMITGCDIEASRKWIGLVIHSLEMNQSRTHLFDLDCHITLIYHKTKKLPAPDVDLRPHLRFLQEELKRLRKGHGESVREDLFLGSCATSTESYLFFFCVVSLLFMYPFVFLNMITVYG